MHNWISELPDEIGSEVQRHCVPRALLDGECLYRNGDASEACFRVISGKLKICNFNYDGQELLQTYLVEGDCIGDYGLLIDTPRMNCAFACGPTEIGVLRKNDFFSLYEKHPEIPRALNRVLSRRMRFLSMLADDASLLPLRQRLSRAIVRMGHSLGQVNEDGSATLEGISHDELGKMVGAARQSVGRELKALEREGAIKIEYGKLIIHDMAAFGGAHDGLLGVEPVAPDYSEPD